MQSYICYIALADQISIKALFEKLLYKNVFHCYNIHNKRHITYQFMANLKALEIF